MTNGPGHGVLDVRRLSFHPRGLAAPEVWGVLFLILIEGIVFIAAIGSYFHLRILNPAWPPAGIDRPDLLLPSLDTLVLLLIVPPVLWAARDLRRGSDRAARIAMPIIMALLAVSLILKLLEYGDKPWGATTHVYGSIVMLMTALHIMHSFTGILAAAVALAYIRAGRIEPARPATFEALAVYWFFIAGIALPLYFVLYLSPHVLP
jgi:heme/copper-type cytochrome/quinol oxidase subunit 3